MGYKQGPHRKPFSACWLSTFFSIPLLDVISTVYFQEHLFLSVSSSMANIEKNSKCISYNQICDQKVDCDCEADDELAALCKPGRYGPNHCDTLAHFMPQRITERSIFCSADSSVKTTVFWRESLPHFSLANKSIYPHLPSDYHPRRRRSPPVVHETTLETSSELLRSKNLAVQLHCYGGIPVMVSDKKRCFCPPSLYGEHCQFQNQRISLSLQIGAPQWRTLFRFIIFLFDNKNEQIIQSYHRVDYLSIRDCGTKFHINLLYLSRPKSQHTSYSIRIDVFDVEMLEYRASWLYPIRFTFLPVYRLAIQLVVPSQRVKLVSRCSLKCGSHGNCTVYANIGSFFCRCDSGWSGPLCQSRFICDCATDSLCVGTWSNRSMCVCPMDKFGLRCYLTNAACGNLPVTKQCKNGGRCIPTDQRIPKSVLPSITCACPESFQGAQCQNLQTRLDIFFSDTLIPPEFVHLHFITVKSFPSMNGQDVQWDPHERTTTFRKIPIDQQMISIYWNNSFHVVFFRNREEHLPYSCSEHIQAVSASEHNHRSKSTMPTSTRTC
jgi:hypothetical protein